MDEGAREALEGSIQKWTDIRNGTGEDHASNNCPLCIMFMDVENPDTSEGCFGCPVAAKTESYGCLDTPYDAWSRANREVKFPYKADTPEKQDIAQDMLDFLKELRPKE